MKDGVLILWNATAIFEMPKTLLADGKSPYERRFGEPFKGTIIPFGVIVGYHPTSPKDQAIIHQYGKNVLPRILLGYELIAGGIRKGDILKTDLEDLEKLDASNFYLRRINAKEVLIRQKENGFIFSVAGGSAKLLERGPRIPRTHSKAGADRED